MHVVGHDALVPSHRKGAQAPPVDIVPALTTRQVPIAPAVLQAWHAPSQAVAQHTPSAQNPDWHAASLEHALPTGATGEHAPAAQKDPATQSLSLAHSVRHAVAPH